ncbi:MAG: hypothetical protein CVU57_13525 [Deltaproteobacteria bacterium HGW-Deltaproteobacteria-15]|jgi:phosphatidylinositol alpha-1,6-mannosyltransferase|nr:MAG: hypothetical protein CVU57_13525 [Deltaproteobacteria bacterium HGW-Deltaproteobacteria-15]
MRILFVTPGCFDKGGISRYSRYQITALRELWGEASVRVFSLLGKTFDSFEQDFQVSWSAGGNRGVEKCRFSLRLAKEIFLWRPDVLHVAHVNLSCLGYGLSKLIGAKSILNTYGLEVWSGLSPDARFGLRRTQRVLSDCFFTAHYLEKRGFRPNNTTTVIWDCVDLKRFYPCKPSPAILEKYRIPGKESHFNVMTLGRLSRAAAHKGYERLLKVFSIVSSSYPKCRLIIAGKGDMRQELYGLAETLGLSENVIFTGMVQDDHLPDVYRAAHVFSLVSDRGHNRGEGIPLTPLEAMACGIPILVGNQDGSQEAVEDGENGFILDPFDFKAHAGVIERLINDKELYDRLAKGAVKRAQKEFSYRDFREKHRRLYSDLLNERQVYER